jgi:hypothetical protein
MCREEAHLNELALSTSLLQSATNLKYKENHRASAPEMSGSVVILYLFNVEADV